MVYTHARTRTHTRTHTYTHTHTHTHTNTHTQIHTHTHTHISIYMWIQRKEQNNFSRSVTLCPPVAYTNGPLTHDNNLVAGERHIF